MDAHAPDKDALIRSLSTLAMIAGVIASSIALGEFSFYKACWALITDTNFFLGLVTPPNFREFFKPNAAPASKWAAIFLITVISFLCGWYNDEFGRFCWDTLVPLTGFIPDVHVTNVTTFLVLVYVVVALCGLRYAVINAMVFFGKYFAGSVENLFRVLEIGKLLD